MKYADRVRRVNSKILERNIVKKSLRERNGEELGFRSIETGLHLLHRELLLRSVLREVERR